MKFVESQPPLPPQGRRIGSTPAPVKTIIPRAVIDLDDGYFPWATDFALLSDEYINEVAPCFPTGHWTQMYPQKPAAEGGTYHRLHLGHAELRVDYLQPSGWMIELWQEVDCKPPDPRILTHVLANVPVLCSTFRAAIRLAEASFPTTHYLVHWRSVF